MLAGLRLQKRTLHNSTECGKRYKHMGKILQKHCMPYTSGTHFIFKIQRHTAPRM